MLNYPCLIAVNRSITKYDAVNIEQSKAKNSPNTDQRVWWVEILDANINKIAPKQKQQHKIVRHGIISP